MLILIIVNYRNTFDIANTMDRKFIYSKQHYTGNDSCAFTQLHLLQAPVVQSNDSGILIAIAIRSSSRTFHVDVRFKLKILTICYTCNTVRNLFVALIKFPNKIELIMTICYPADEDLDHN